MAGIATGHKVSPFFLCIHPSQIGALLSPFNRVGYIWLSGALFKKKWQPGSAEWRSEDTTLSYY
jgi:hypothetical protein